MTKRNNQANGNSIFSHAIKYAELGYEVFPLVPGQKIPATKNGCKDATTDIEQIERWIKKSPNTNVGIRGGTAVLIIDIDNKDGKNGSDDLAEIERELGNLPDCPTVKTPTGGYHLYFKYPGVDVIGQAGVEWKGRKTGIDLRVGNQYVVAPPSALSNADTGYQWETPLIPKHDLPELPQTWVDCFLPKRNEAVTKAKPPTNPEVKGSETLGTVFPLVINDEAEQKVVEYLKTCPKAVQGKSGHRTLCSVALALVRGFKLEPQRAADIAWEYYNFYCFPFWTDGERKDFDRKFHEAKKWKCPKPDGWLLDGKEALTEIMAWRPIPIECLPPVLRNFCLAAAKATNTDVAYIITFILPMLASSVGSHLVAEVKRGWNVPAIIWDLVVAFSGSGKSPVWKAAIRVLIKIQNEFSKQYEKDMKIYTKEMEKYHTDLAQWRAERKKDKTLEPPVKPEPPKEQFCFVSDTTTEALIPILADNPYGVCASYNEAATFFGSLDAYRSGGGGKDEGIYNDIYDGGYVQVNRKDKPSIIAERTHCSICGGIQPDALKLILKRNPQFFYSGFLARFLLCMPPDVPRPYNDESIPEDIENAYSRITNSLFFWRKKAKRSTPASPCRLRLTQEAKVAFINFHDSLADERSALPSGAMKAALSKLSGYAVRIALTLHVAHFASFCPDGQIPTKIPPIDERAMKAAISLTRWYWREAQRILQSVRPHEVVAMDKEITAILGLLQKHGKITVRMVTRNRSVFSGDGAADRATQKLEAMLKDGVLVADEQKADNGVVVKYYSLSNAADTATADAVFDENENGVDGVRNGVDDKIDANSNDYNGLENGVGVGDIWRAETEKDYTGFFEKPARSRDKVAIEEFDEEYADDCEVPM